MSYNLKLYVIGEDTAKELIKVLNWTNVIWKNTPKHLFLDDILAELKCQVE